MIILHFIDYSRQERYDLNGKVDGQSMSVHYTFEKYNGIFKNKCYFFNNDVSYTGKQTWNEFVDLITDEEDRYFSISYHIKRERTVMKYLVDVTFFPVGPAPAA
jgi:hypothetical protein